MLASFPARILNHKSPPKGIPRDSILQKCALVAANSVLGLVTFLTLRRPAIFR